MNAEAPLRSELYFTITFLLIKTTGSAGGLFCAYKAPLPAGISRCVERSANRTSFSTSPKGLILLPGERIYIFFKC